METKHFELIVEKHSLCPQDKLYNANALCGEVGECANQVKKIAMGTLRPDWVLQNENALPTVESFEAALIDELGDALFYLTRLALDNGTNLEELMYLQFKKLATQSGKYKRTFLK